jgi:hypothetical protein
MFHFLVEYYPQITTLLTDLGASQTEVSLDSDMASGKIYKINVRFHYRFLLLAFALFAFVFALFAFVLICVNHESEAEGPSEARVPYCLAASLPCSCDVITGKVYANALSISDAKDLAEKSCKSQFGIH